MSGKSQALHIGVSRARRYLWWSILAVLLGMWPQRLVSENNC
jgi:hypothetical protein